MSSDTPSKILIVQPSWVGDAVMATPTLRALRELYPAAHISYLMRRYVKPIYTGIPWADQLITYRTGKTRAKAGKGQFFDLAARLRAAKFDMAILLPNSFKSALVCKMAGIKRIADAEVSVSAYPEKHPEARDFDADIDVLKAKVDAGAARAITQVFFDNDLYFRYLDRVRARGIEIPVVPGIMPMHNFKQARNFVTRAGTSVPDWLAEKFEGLDDTRKLVAATVAAGQVQKLAKHGVDTFHFYTMNRADLVFAISHLLGIRPGGAQKAA